MLSMLNGGARVGQPGEMVGLNGHCAMIAWVEGPTQPGNAVVALYRYKLTTGETLNVRELEAETLLHFDDWRPATAVLLD